jgi:hypothetical protein
MAVVGSGPRRSLRIEASAALAAVGGLAIFVSLFLPWYDPDITAWTAFEVLDLVLAGIAIASVVGAAGEVGLVGIAPARQLPLLGAAAVVIVVAALINHPPLALGHPPKVGIWLAFGGSLVLLTGGLLRVARVSLAVTFDLPDAEPRVTPPPPAPPEASTEPLPRRPEP